MQQAQVDTYDFLDVEGYGYGLMTETGTSLGRGARWLDTKVVTHDGAGNPLVNNTQYFFRVVSISATGRAPSTSASSRAVHGA